MRRSRVTTRPRTDSSRNRNAKRKRLKREFDAAAQSRRPTEGVEGGNRWSNVVLIESVVDICQNHNGRGSGAIKPSALRSRGVVLLVPGLSRSWGRSKDGEKAKLVLVIARKGTETFRPRVSFEPTRQGSQANNDNWHWQDGIEDQRAIPRRRCVCDFAYGLMPPPLSSHTVEAGVTRPEEEIVGRRPRQRVLLMT